MVDFHSKLSASKLTRLDVIIDAFSLKVSPFGHHIAKCVPSILTRGYGRFPLEVKRLEVTSP